MGLLVEKGEKSSSFLSPDVLCVFYLLFSAGLLALMILVSKYRPSQAPGSSLLDTCPLGGAGS